MNRTKKIFFPKLKKITDLRSSEYPEQGKQINKQKYFQLNAEEGKGKKIKRKKPEKRNITRYTQRNEEL